MLRRHITELAPASKDSFPSPAAAKPAAAVGGMPFPGLLTLSAPLLAVYGWLDPPDFHLDSQKLIRACEQVGKPVSVFWVPGRLQI